MKVCTVIIFVTCAYYEASGLHNILMVLLVLSFQMNVRIPFKKTSLVFNIIGEGKKSILAPSVKYAKVV